MDLYCNIYKHGRRFKGKLYGRISETSQKWCLCFRKLLIQTICPDSKFFERFLIGNIKFYCLHVWIEKRKAI